MVTVVCTTYNHENFIRDCLNGILIQKTTFPFEIIIHDDASTDNTAVILREYELKHQGRFNNIYQSEINTQKKIQIFGLI
jgi:glycosyltransferase involved in cell wall biosynthesis